MTLHTLSAVAQRWDLQADHKDPERWLAAQIKSGRFRGRKVGRSWRMRDDDIAHNEDVMLRGGVTAPTPIGARRGPSVGSLRRRSA